MNTKKDHFPFTDFLDYVESKLEPELRKQIGEHLESGCPECQTELKTTRRLLAGLQVASWPRPSRQSRQAVLRAFRRDLGKSNTTRTWNRPALAGGLAIGIIIAALFLVFPKSATAATLVNVRGTVSVIDHTSGVELASKEGAQINSGTEIRTGYDASATLKLPDGSEVHLGGSSLLYLNQLEKIGDYWSINMFQGTGITQHLVDTRNTKYSLQTESGQVAVKGTEFSIEILGDGSVRVVVAKGLVEINTRNNTIKLDPGMIVRYFPEGNIEVMMPEADPTSSGNPKTSATSEPIKTETENSNDTNQTEESFESEETESPDIEPTEYLEETPEPEEEPESESD